jgi:DNA-binding response OmpR family regulator
MNNLNANTKILIVDDERGMCNLIKNAFYPVTRYVSVRMSVTSAIDFLTSRCVDILITDVNLPVKDGFELVEWVRYRSEFPRLSIIMMTGVILDEKSVLMSKKLRVDKYLAKPFDIQDLIRFVDELVDPDSSMAEEIDATTEEPKDSFELCNKCDRANRHCVC